MKVYQINIVCGFGSTGRIVVDLAQTIEKEGGSCRIAYGRKNAPDTVDSFKFSNRLEVYSHVLMTRLMDRHGLYSKKATKRLIEDIKKYEPHIIHLHNIHGYYVNFEMLFHFLKEYNKPVVWTLHDCWAFTGHCAHFDYVGCQKWRDMCYNCPQKMLYPHSLVFDNCTDNYRRKKRAFTSISNMTLVTVSEWLKDVAKQGFLQKYLMKRISNGIDLVMMHPVESDIRAQYGLEDKKIILGVASFWHERKGIYTFYKLAEKIPENYVIVLIGAHKEKKEEIPKNILNIGRISDPQELVKWYTAADIYVNASAEETMGLTTVEAMACGTPAVVMNATANPELVDEGCGCVVEPGDIQQLLAAIYSLEKDEKTIVNCLERARCYEKTKQYKEYIKLYRDILAEEEK